MHIKLEAARTQAQHLIEGIATMATAATIEIRSLKLDGADHRLNGASYRGTSWQEALTSGTGQVRSMLFLFVGVLDDRLGHATRQLLPQGPDDSVG